MGSAILRRFGLSLAVCLGLTACAADSSTGIGVNLVPEAQVKQAGERAWQDIRAQVPASPNAEYQARAQKVADRLLTAAGENPANWQVEVFQSDQINAFALPNDRIGIYAGMMKLADTDPELAAVIGHEIGHVEAHHAQQRMSTEVATQVGVDVLGALLGGVGGGNASQLAGLLGVGAQYGVILPYSRNQELQADQLGLDYMARAGYDPRAAVTLWQKMLKAVGTGGPSFLSTHPATPERIQRLEAEMPKAMQEYRAVKG